MFKMERLICHITQQTKTNTLLCLYKDVFDDCVEKFLCKLQKYLVNDIFICLHGFCMMHMYRFSYWGLLGDVAGYFGFSGRLQVTFREFFRLIEGFQRQLIQQTAVVCSRPHPPMTFNGTLGWQRALFRKQIDGHFKDWQVWDKFFFVANWRGQDAGHSMVTRILKFHCIY